MTEDEFNKVFDVTKPDKVSPSASSKPVIVGHRPAINDPMVRDDSAASMPHENRSSIPVMMDDDKAPHPDHTETHMGSEMHTPAAEPTSAEPTGASPSPLEGLSESHFMNTSMGSNYEANEPPQDNSHLMGPQPLPIPKGAGPKRNWLKWLLWLILLAAAVAGAYYGYNHYYKNNKTASQPVITPVATPKAVVPTIPQGFTQFKLADTTISFAYPTTWGTTVVTTDLGFSKRGTSQKSDGTYAYLINFSQNKDVQVAITSAKLLPPARGAQYYDFLQWCTGTADSKYYKTILHFTTDTTKIDTPTTTTCDQGPLADATKVDNSTIVQIKTKNPDGSALGDLYTLNLTNKDLPVMRVKDAVSTNGDNIKKLLDTVKSTSVSTNSSSSTTSH